MGVCLLAQAPEPSREQTHIADNGYNWHHYMVSTYHSSLKKKTQKKIRAIGHPMPETGKILSEFGYITLYF